MKRKGLFFALIICLLAVMGWPTSVEASSARQADNPDDPLLQCTQGVLLLLSGNAELAVPSLEAGFEGRAQVGAENREMMNMCALYLGMQRYTMNDLSGALEAYEYALDGFRALEDQQLEWSMLYGMSAVYMSQGDYPGAVGFLEQALSLTQQAQQAQQSDQTEQTDQTGQDWAPETMPFFAEVATQNNLGYVYGLQGRYEQAQANFEAAEQALERYDQLVQEMGGIEAIAGGVAAPNEIMEELQEQLAQFGGATGEASGGQLLLQDMLAQGSKTLKVALLNNRGEISRLQGNYELAHENLGAALDLLREEGDSSAGNGGPAVPSVFTNNSVSEGVVLNNIGLLYVDQKQYDEALEHFQQARASMQALGDVAGEVAVLDNIGSWHAIQEQYDDALLVLQDALTLAADNPLAQAPVHQNIGQVHFAQGRYSEALDSFQQALVQMTTAGHLLGEAEARAKVADVYIMQGRYEQARDELEQSLLIMRQKDLLSGQALMLNSIGATYQAQGRFQDALDAYQQALEILRILKDKKHEIGALNNIGVVQIEQGAYKDALFTLELALELEDEVKDRDTRAVTLNTVGTVYRQQGRYGEALRSFEQAKAIMEEIGSQASKGQVLNNIGSVYHATGRYDEALEQFNEALALQREVGNRAEEATTLNNIGTVYGAQARYGQAFDQFQQAQDIWQELGAPQQVGQSLINIGSLYQAQGRNEEALEQFEQALEHLREVNHPLGEATALRNIGSIYLDQENFKEAFGQYEQALQIQREIGDQAGEALTLSSMGVGHVYQDNDTDGLELLQESLAIRQKIGDRAGEGAVLANIAAIHLAQGAYEEALAHYQEALAIVREVGERANEGIVLRQIGYVYEQQGQEDEALAHYEKAMAIYESVRAAAGSEFGRISFATQYVGLYEDVVKLYHARGEDEKAFLTSERGRARAFLDSLATDDVQLSDETSAELLAQERTLYAKQQATRTALAQARAHPLPVPEWVTALEQELQEIEQNHAAVLAQIEALDEKLTQLIPGRTQQASLSEIQEQIDPNTTLLSYYMLGNDETLAFLITRDELHVVTLGVCCTDIDEQIAAFYKKFSDPFFDVEDARLSDALQQLYQWLIAPVKPHLNTPGVMIVPHKVLHYLPFAALTDGESYLADEYVLFTVPSVGALPLIQQNQQPDATLESILALGNPTFDPNLPQLEGQILSNLPFAAQEAESVASLFADQAQVRTGAEATESLLSTFRGAQADILHVAAHGIYDADDPLSSMLVLANDGEENGLLEVSEVYDMDLKGNNLVVLSACETGIQSRNKQKEGESVVIAGDEIVALNRAFLYAGTPTIISSLWTVDDQATGQLMEHFYTHLQAGSGKAEALRQAQLDTREEFPHPYYWAGFVLAGDSGQISNTWWGWLASQAQWLMSQWQWLAGGTGLLLVIGGIAAFFYRRRTRKSTRYRRGHVPRRRY